MLEIEALFKLVYQSPQLCGIFRTALTQTFLILLGTMHMAPTLTKGKVAFVTGANGITGNALIEHLIRQPSSEWYVTDNIMSVDEI